MLLQYRIKHLNISFLRQGGGRYTFVNLPIIQPKREEYQALAFSCHMCVDDLGQTDAPPAMENEEMVTKEMIWDLKHTHGKFT